MVIDGTQTDGFKLRLRQGKWWLELYNDNAYLKLDFGPFTYNDAMSWIEANPELIDIDKLLTKIKVDAENRNY